MNPNEALSKLMLCVREDRTAVAAEYAALEVQHGKLSAAAAENTLSGHLRQAIHASHRPLRDIAKDAEIDMDCLSRFLEGDATVSSATLDRLADAAGVVVTLSKQT